MKLTFDTFSNQMELQGLTKADPDIQEAVKAVIRVLKKRRMPYVKAKEVLDYSNQVLLNEFLNEKKL